MGLQEITGELKSVPAGAHAPNSRELHADFFRTIGRAAGDDEAITNRVSKDTEKSVLLDLRHLTLRGETASKVMLVRDHLEYAFKYAKPSPLKFKKSRIDYC